MTKETQLRRAFVFFHLVLAAVVFIQSAATALSASGWLSGRALNLHLILFGIIEAVLAVAFVLPRTVRAGSVGLVAVFAFASVLHVRAGEFPGALLVYAAGAAFVGVHGAAYWPHAPKGAATA